MKIYNISANPIQVIKHLDDKATSPVLFNSRIENWLRTAAGVRQGCLLSPNLFNAFLERIMTDTSEIHVSIGDRTITNIRFANDIDGLAGEEGELATLAERLGKAFTAYSVDISAEKTKLMTNNTSGLDKEIKANEQQLQTVTSFKYLASVVSDEDSKPEILSRKAQTTTLTRLKLVWNDRSISVSSTIRLMHSLVTSIFLYACE